MNVLELFAGAGGGILGGLILGHRPVCAVELDKYAADRLRDRQDDGVLPPFPIWRGDIREFDGQPWAGRVDIVSGGFPCQDISPAGSRDGIAGQRSGLWSEMLRVVREVRPGLVFVENSAEIAVRGINRVLGDLARLRYDAVWGVFGACSVGAWHHRPRMWILAGDPLISEADRGRQHDVTIDAKVAGLPSISDDADTDSPRRDARGGSGRSPFAEPERLPWWTHEPELARVAHGVAARMDRVRAMGNGQVPAVHALAFRVLRRRLMGESS